MSKKSAIIIGAGIVGLAAARALAIKGYKVSVFEKTDVAVGASIRNFGMVWPIGQPIGKLYDRAIRSRNIWKEICKEANIWHSPKGSIHVAYEKDEMQTMEEFVDLNASLRDCRLLTAEQAIALSPAINPNGLIGGFYSGEEVIVDPREAISKIPNYFQEKYNIDFHFATPITGITYPYIWSGNSKYSADEIYICSGQEFESLYPEVYMNSPLTKCKLQMMRTLPQSNGFNIGPALCGGLTLLHYAAFKECPTLDVVKARMNEQYPEYIKWGIHVMMSQNGNNELVIGDSHEYGFTHDPFNREDINTLILDYLKKFARFPDWTIQQIWNGTYVKMKEGTELVTSPEEGVTIVNGLGGAGMTLSFGLLEEVVSN
jgi:FAD dependent oxidoreductase TIGR03364